MVILVKRQIRFVDDDDEEEEDEENRDEVIVMTDKQGKTDAKNVDMIVMDTDEIFL